MQTLEQRQGLKIACIEEIVLVKQFIGTAEFECLIEPLPGPDHGAYLRGVLAEHVS